MRVRNLVRFSWLFILLSAVIVEVDLAQAAKRSIGDVNRQQTQPVPYKIILKGGEAGAYQAFPDATRLVNGDILAVFYAGDAHVTKANPQYPNSGRICMVRYKDEGKIWTVPVLLYGDITDKRDAHITQLKSGTIICTFFNLTIDSLKMKHGEVRMVMSTDNGLTRDKSSRLIAKNWFCSAQVRELKDGSLLQRVYTL